MCDYSLHSVNSRPAKVGDELVTTKFANSLTRGFCPLGEPNVAVCLSPGTEIAFKEEARDDHPLAWLFPQRLRFGKIGHTVARCRQINIGRRDTHHDALEFANGKLVLVTHLRPDQRATVLQLPVQRSAATAQSAARAQPSPVA
jgi:hypothetical protein